MTRRATDPAADEHGSFLDDLIEHRTIVICCGSGGVGKTTTAATIALEGARRGKRAVVVTIDPAKRLADALGLGSLSNEPRQVDGVGPGELWAVMLDTKATFDEVVNRYADSPSQRDRILSNRFYRNISGTLSGTQEYMAAEKLYDLHHGDLHHEGPSRRFDLVVVDTPPSRNALDFIDAPRKLTNFLDHKLYRLLTAPSRGLLRPVNVAAQAFVKTAAKVVGASVIDDAITFFQAFDGMEAGFRERADKVLRLLTDPGTAFVLVASPRPDAVAEARYFTGRLAQSDIAVEALVVNRVHPRFATRSAGEVSALARQLDGDPELASMLDDLAGHLTVADREEQGLADLRAAIGTAPVVKVPLLHTDVHDLSGLDGLRAHLFSGHGTDAVRTRRRG
ncbi:MAG: ArsA family ATPase [Acidimicrobiia bacterium]